MRSKLTNNGIKCLACTISINLILLTTIVVYGKGSFAISIERGQITVIIEAHRIVD